MTARVATVRCKTCGNDEAHSRCNHSDAAKEFVTINSIEFLERDQIKLNKLLSTVNVATSAPDFVHLQFHDRCSVVEPSLANAINDEIKLAITSTATRKKLTFWNFVSRPWSLSTSSLSTLEDFDKVFKMRSNQFEIQNPESKFVDIVLGKHFQQLYACNLHYIKRVDLQEWSLPVHATPDALWTYEGEQYVIEFKTVRSFKGMTAEKFSKWLLQTGCNHLPMYDESSVSSVPAPISTSISALMNDTPDNSSSPVNPANTPLQQRYLLVLITLEAPCSTLVLEIHAEANLRACVAQWHDWFDRTEYKVFKAEHLISYHLQQCNMNQIIEEYTQERKKKKVAPSKVKVTPKDSVSSSKSNKPQSAAAKNNRYDGLFDSSSDEGDSGSEGADDA